MRLGEKTMVVLIAGASHTGKTALAQSLLEQKGYPYLSIDLLKMGLIRSGQTSSWLIKGNKKKGKAQSRRYQRQVTRINCDFTRLVL